MQEEAGVEEPEEPALVGFRNRVRSGIKQSSRKGGLSEGLAARELHVILCLVTENGRFGESGKVEGVL